jgi:transposase
MFHYNDQGVPRDYSTVYIGLDVHAQTCIMSWMDEEGEVQGSSTFETSAEQLITHVENIDADTKMLTLEESSLAYWTARTLTEEVDRIVVCDPRENFLISRSVRKGDQPDAQALSRLLRMDELKEVYQPDSDRRALYKQACNHYMDLRDQQRRLKQKIKSRLKRWGLFHIPGAKVYAKSGRQAYLEELRYERIRSQVESLYGLLDQVHEAKQRARREFLELGRPYQEVREFQKMPGIGPISAHTFDAIIQTPHRFATKQKLWRYCKLGIRKHSSGGHQVHREKLDPAGNGELKALSHRIWKEALKGDQSNEVRTSYQRSLQRTNNEVHARLNTQRKILATMWGLWKNETSYDPDIFLG